MTALRFTFAAIGTPGGDRSDNRRVRRGTTHPVMMSRRLPALAASLVLFVLSACQEPTEPSVPLGVFVLHDIAGVAPPVTYDWGLDGTLSVLYDTIELDGAGTAIRALRIRRTGSIYEVDTVYDVYTPQRPLKYRLDGT